MRGKVGGEYENPEAGTHKARCIKIIDKGTHYNEKFNNMQHELNIMFELCELKMKKGENAGKPFAISLGFQGSITLSMSAKSNLRPKIETWLGKKFTDKEAAEFDIDTLLGKPAYVNVMNTEKDENIYANIAAILPAKESDIPEAINPLVLFDLSNFDQNVFDKLPEKTRHRIEASDEWEFRFNGGGEIAQAESRAQNEQLAGNVVTDVEEDEIPFSQPDNEIAQDTQTKTDEIDIKAIGKEGEEELDRSIINFKKEYEALPKKTWSAVNALCKRKMGESDYKDFYMLGEYGNPDKDKYDPLVQAKIAKELITVCKARA